METIDDGGLHCVDGILLGSARCGIKTHSEQPDVALVLSEAPASAAGVFTRNAFAAAPVLWCRRLLPTDSARAVLINAGNANACTGEQGERDVRASTGLVADLVSAAPEQVLAASTGIIGHPLPMDKLTRGIRDAAESLGAEREAALAAERAIMTTDTHPKACAVRSQIDGLPFHVAGMAKGSGMIAPHMATMLCLVATDAAVPPSLLDRHLREAADLTFNRITVDGDTSTNDSVIMLATGTSGVRIRTGTNAEGAFRPALQAVLADLAQQVVRDGEGATKLLTVSVEGAADAGAAETAARAVAESQLVKCAVYGGDPNWGRIVCAVGYSGVPVQPHRVSVDLGGVRVFAGGTPTGDDASGEMQGPDVRVTIRLGDGPGEAAIQTCDLTEEYVRINAEYHT
ncbi:MAG: bifunctional glutamate N-acetyltransferase/amino-acid acetyltransferase ArgJ [Candidatus Brocadiia bacterium]